MTNVERLKEEWLAAKEACWQLIRERIVLNEVTKNKKNRSGNLSENPLFDEENNNFEKKWNKLEKKAEMLRRRLLNLYNKQDVDCYDGFIVCSCCRGMFAYQGSCREKDRLTHTFNRCKDHEGRTESFTAQDLEEIWTR